MPEQNDLKVNDLLSKIEDLPTLPTVFAELERQLSDPKVTANEIAGIIEKDMALASRILKIVNSAYYGFPKKIDTISRSVVILGFNEIKNIALSVSIIDMFNSKKKQAGLDFEQFWTHSLAVGIISSLIARKSGKEKIESPETAFLSGLLHDIGRIVLDQFVPQYPKVIAVAKSKNYLLTSVEDAVFGFTHMDVGRLLIKRWNLPESLMLVAGYHSKPIEKQSISNSKIFPLISAVHTADIIARAANFGNAGDDFVPPFYNQCWEVLNLSLGDLEDLVTEGRNLLLTFTKLLLT